MPPSRRVPSTTSRPGNREARRLLGITQSLLPCPDLLLLFSPRNRPSDMLPRRGKWGLPGIAGGTLGRWPRAASRGDLRPRPESPEAGRWRPPFAPLGGLLRSGRPPGFPPVIRGYLHSPPFGAADDNAEAAALRRGLLARNAQAPGEPGAAGRFEKSWKKSQNRFPKGALRCPYI